MDTFDFGSLLAALFATLFSLFFGEGGILAALSTVFGGVG